LTSRAAALTKTGILTIAASLIGFGSAAAPASAGLPAELDQTAVVETADIPAAKAIGVLSPEHKLAEFSLPVIVATSEAAVETPVIRPMAEGTYRDTSLYGPRWGSVHTGTDMAASVGTPIYAIADGEVVWAGGGKDGRSGQLVIIHHVIDGQDVWSWYGHMYTNEVYVSEGDKVTAGQLIAGVGSNGNSTGPHLHFEIHTGEIGNHVDPLQFLADAGAPHPTAN